VTQDPLQRRAPWWWPAEASVPGATHRAATPADGTDSANMGSPLGPLPPALLAVLQRYVADIAQGRRRPNWIVEPDLTSQQMGDWVPAGAAMDDSGRLSWSDTGEPIAIVPRPSIWPRIETPDGTAWVMPKTVDILGGVLGPVAGITRAVRPMAQAPARLRPASEVEHTLPSLGGSTGEMLECRNWRMYDAPSLKEPRSFNRDYPPEKWPDGPPIDEQGRLTRDMDGRPLVAERVVGRRMVGGEDQAIPPAELDPLAARATGKVSQVVSSRRIGGDVERVIKTTDRRTGAVEYEIQLNSQLLPKVAPRGLAHGIGHVIDDMAGKIPIDGIVRELEGVYNTLATGIERSHRRTLPRHFGYTSQQSPRELMAEGIRAFLTNPGYFKQVAPRAAERIREYVNSHPEMSKFIQFNAGGAPPFGALTWPEPDR
jgi:hypothetical protein